MLATERALANLRHDMRTLLNAILGYTALWLEDLPERAEPQLSENLTQIHALGQSLLIQVNDLLAASRLLDASYTAGLAERLRADMSGQVEDVISKTGVLYATSKAGPEMLMADLRKIESAGQKLLAMLAGVESTIAASAADDGTLAAPCKPGPSAPSGRGLVLVVDDNEVNRDVLLRRLERDGHVVNLAENGAKALAILENEPCDLVLLDIMMPEMNGFQTLERIRADARWADLPVIMISSLDEMDSVIRCIEMGAEDYLPKPFDPVLLRARVGACLEKKRLREERAAQQKAEQERLRWELEMAARVQQKLLPECAPSVAGFDLAGACLPVRTVGGDYFDILKLDECHLGLVTADVAGKGMAAALVMAALAASLRSQAHLYADSIAGLADALNVQMHAWTDTSKFVTLFYGCLDLPHHRLHYVNAGHNVPLLVRGAERKVTRIPDVGGPVLGVLPQVRYEKGSIDLDRGDILLTYTDGVTEAFDPQYQEFGEERLAAAILGNLDKPAAAILESITAEVRDWCGASPQSDDLTLLVMKVL